MSRAAGRSLADIDLEFIKEHSKAITDGSPVRYVKEAMLHGSLWGEVDDGSVSCANTEFYVSHKEPDDALKQIQESGETWPLGALLEGHEFSVVVNVG